MFRCSSCEGQLLMALAEGEQPEENPAGAFMLCMMCTGPVGRLQYVKRLSVEEFTELRIRAGVPVDWEDQP